MPNPTPKQPTEEDNKQTLTEATANYIGNKVSKEFHKPTCSCANRMLKQNKMYFRSIEDALRQGYNGCKHCLPAFDKGQPDFSKILTTGGNPPTLVSVIDRPKKYAQFEAQVNIKPNIQTDDDKIIEFYSSKKLFASIYLNCNWVIKECEPNIYLEEKKLTYYGSSYVFDPEKGNEWNIAIDQNSLVLTPLDRPDQQMRVRFTEDELNPKRKISMTITDSSACRDEWRKYSLDDEGRKYFDAATSRSLGEINFYLRTHKVSFNGAIKPAECLSGNGIDGEFLQDGNRYIIAGNGHPAQLIPEGFLDISGWSQIKNEKLGYPTYQVVDMKMEGIKYIPLDKGAIVFSPVTGCTVFNNEQWNLYYPIRRELLHPIVLNVYKAGHMKFKDSKGAETGYIYNIGHDGQNEYHSLYGRMLKLYDQRLLSLPIGEYGYHPMQQLDNEQKPCWNYFWKWQEFQNGAIFIDDKDKEYILYGPIWKKYCEINGENAKAYSAPKTGIESLEDKYPQIGTSKTITCAQFQNALIVHNSNDEKAIAIRTLALNLDYAESPKDSIYDGSVNWGDNDGEAELYGYMTIKYNDEFYKIYNNKLKKVPVDRLYCRNKKIDSKINFDWRIPVKINSLESKLYFKIEYWDFDAPARGDDDEELGYIEMELNIFNLWGSKNGDVENDYPETPLTYYRKNACRRKHEKTILTSFSVSIIP